MSPGPPATQPEQARPVSRHKRLIVVVVCAFTIILDGYDLTVYGAIVPSLLEYQQWDVSEAEAGTLGSYALIGMLIGALVVGTLTDLVGRRRIVIGCVIWFSTGMLLTAFAPTPEAFGLLRFVTGLGLGGVIPTAIALTLEYAEPHRRNMTNAIMFSGYAIGGIAAALVAIPVLARFEWQTLFWLGALPALVLVPLAYFALPESPNYLRARGREEEARKLADRYGVTLEESPEAPRDRARSKGALSNVGALVGRDLLAGTLLFWVANGMGLLLVYGLNTWLAGIMFSAGFPLGSSLTFLMALNLGAILGAPTGGALADRFGSKRVVTTMFATAAACILIMSMQPPMVLLYVCVAVAGACTIGTTILVNSFTGNFYPAALRATGLGWALAVGRIGAIIGPIYGGLVVGSGLGVEVNFYAFVIPAVIGAFAVVAVPRSRAAVLPEKTAQPVDEQG
ncbi:AAHS family benzoate transporter-like MFS transporter [Lipingzhangella halophila]|uniref:AAHS family benzoate transporter-like MFS transporter n=1 Tax=Lipingzhangella halophila TaxID=1783352 RepID=A0A7W7W2C3_9ACTN|nr:aromatic acid/H+ symport family MFS transporter [Lipingzhangella halophila]MBB4930510.1 AAHS family benzoate transporter-like MFS transporter [Lipingzhangella halophila]